MDNDRARTLLDAERTRVSSLLADTTAQEGAERDGVTEPGDMYDVSQPLESEAVDDAVAASLRERLAAIDRAEARLAAGTYGVSVRSGDTIPDERLEHDPAAELTVEEARA
jgi:DnaK suppressor protein